MYEAHRVLLDDLALIKVNSHVTDGGADQLYTKLIGLGLPRLTLAASATATEIPR